MRPRDGRKILIYYFSRQCWSAFSLDQALFFYFICTSLVIAYHCFFSMSTHGLVHPYCYLFRSARTSSETLKFTRRPLHRKQFLLFQDLSFLFFLHSSPHQQTKYFPSSSMFFVFLLLLTNFFLLQISASFSFFSPLLFSFTWLFLWISYFQFCCLSLIGRNDTPHLAFFCSSVRSPQL